jgi:hypothetical protein
LEEIMLRKVLIAAVATLPLILSTAAFAQKIDDWKPIGEFGWFGVGKTHEIEKGHFYWVGEFTGTFFNDKGENSLFHRAGVKCPAWFDADMNNKKSKAGGYCIITDLAGDQAYLTWQNEGAPGPGGRGPGTFQYTGGTGKYKEINGNGTFVGVTQVNWQDGTSTGYATWNR